MSNGALKFFFEVEKDEIQLVEKKIIHNKNSRKNKIKLSREAYHETLLKWCLFEYLHPKTNNPLHSTFFPLPSSESLNNGLSGDLICTYLNSNVVFDFHQPKKNDKLNIWMEYKHPKTNRGSRPHIGNFISLIFIKEWKMNRNFDHIHNSYKEIKQGKLMLIENKL